MNQIYVDSDTLFQVTDLKNARTLVDINDATITVELFKSDSDTQIGDDITMTAVGSSGDYWCLLPSTNELVAGDRYYLMVTIEAGGNILVKKIKMEAVWSD
jgi:hypothetical protein